jgi:putative transposase
LNGLKKSLKYSVKEKCGLIDVANIEIAISRQCELLGLSRSGYYYEPIGESPLNLQLMNLIDEQYTKTPFYGVDKMTAWLIRQGYKVNPKRIRRLMRKMGIEAIYPKPRLSVSTSEHKKYPYLLRDLEIDRPDYVWCADITYIRMQQGFLYLMAVMDWYSRYVLAWRLSNTLDTGFCLDALNAALAISQPEIFNTDQGVQFTSAEFTKRLQEAEIRISMDGRGRVFDNIFVERLWRTVKYEEVYIHNYESVRDTWRNLERYFSFYNTDRIHESLGYRTPHEVYFGESEAITINRQTDKLIHLI